MRGDRPLYGNGRPKDNKSTPHARGSTVDDKGMLVEVAVYPACAGIDLKETIRGFFYYSLPRMRGDRPQHTLLLPPGQ